MAQFTEVEVLMATGPISYQFCALTDEVIDALATWPGSRCRRCSYRTSRS